MPDAVTDTSLADRVKTILRRDLKLGASTVIEDDMSLIGGDFELDSLDMVMLVTSVEKEFGIKIADAQAGRTAFTDVGSLVRFLETAMASNGNEAEANDAPSADAAPADFDALLAGLPHRDPFRFVSRIVELTPMIEGRGEWDLAGDEDFFKGHFPGHPIVPGVLVGEALAQFSGLVGVDPDASPRSGQLVQVDVRFRKPVAPPATLTLHSKLTQSVGPLQHFDARATHDGQVVAEGKITLNRG